jgi:hypothetical protein
MTDQPLENNMRKIVFLILVASLGLAGCGKTFMRPLAPTQLNEAANPNEAVIVFFRPAKFQGSALTPVLVEVDGKENLSLVAMMPNGKKYLHRTTAGKHSYFWSTPSLFGGVYSYMLEANLKAGKTYYVYVKGSFTPVTDPADEKFRKDLASTSWVANTPEGQIWFKANLDSLKGKYTLIRTIQGGDTPKVIDGFSPVISGLAGEVGMGKTITPKAGSNEIDMKIKPEYGTSTPVR